MTVQERGYKHTTQAMADGNPIPHETIATHIMPENETLNGFQSNRVPNRKTVIFDEALASTDQGVFFDFSRKGKQSARRARDVVRRMGREYLTRYDSLSPEKQSTFSLHFNHEYATYKQELREKQRANLKAYSLLRRGAISVDQINQDGTLDIERIRQNPQIVETMGLDTVHIPQENNYRKAADLKRAPKTEVSVSDGEAIIIFTDTASVVQVPNTDGNLHNGRLHVVDTTDHHEGHGDGEHDCSSEDHHHEHEHSDNKSPVISRLFQKALVVGTLLTGAAEIVTGGTATSSLIADGIHNLGDAGVGFLQTESILNEQLSENQLSRRRRIAYWGISALSAAVAVKAGTEIVTNQEQAENAYAVYTALASLGLNSLLLWRLRQGIKRSAREEGNSVHEADLLKHFVAVDLPSAGIAVAGTLLQKYGVNVAGHAIEPVLGIANGLVGAWVFRPTAKNLDHSDCAKHGHHSHTHDTENSVSRPKNNIRRTLRSLTAGVTATAAMFAASPGVATSHLVSNDTHPTTSTATSHPQDNRAIIPNTAAEVPIVISQPGMPYGSGENPWQRANDKLRESPRDASIIVELTLAENPGLNPTQIAIGQQLNEPSDDAISTAIELSQDGTSEQFNEAMNTLLEEENSNRRDRASQETIISVIRKKLKEKFTIFSRNAQRMGVTP